MKTYLHPSLDVHIPLLRRHRALISLLLIRLKLWQVNWYCVQLQFRAPGMEPQTILFSSVS
jgi:hypothetical protein